MTATGKISIIGCDKDTSNDKTVRTILAVGARRHTTIYVNEATNIDVEKLKKAAAQLGITIQQAKEAMETLARIAENNNKSMREKTETLKEAAKSIKIEENKRTQKIKRINQEQKRLQKRHFQRSKW